MTQQRTNSAETKTVEARNSSSLPPRGRSRWIWFLGAAVIVAVVLYLRHGSAQQAKNNADPPVRPVVVSTAAARKGDIGVYLDALGTVTPVYTVTVTSRVQGEITQVYYHEGQMVPKGDPLQEMNPRPYQAQQ